MLLVLVLLPGFALIPTSCIAAILMVTAFNLIPFGTMGGLLQQDFSEFLLFTFTWVVCVKVDGAWGIVAGGAIALLRFASNNSTCQIYSELIEDEYKVLRLEGNLNYINSEDCEVKLLDLI
jgi:MFS superfamily sulfate permease-like transporter